MASPRPSPRRGGTLVAPCVIAALPVFLLLWGTGAALWPNLFSSGSTASYQVTVPGATVSLNQASTYDKTVNGDHLVQYAYRLSWGDGGLGGEYFVAPMPSLAMAEALSLQYFSNADVPFFGGDVSRQSEGAVCQQTVARLPATAR